MNIIIESILVGVCIGVAVLSAVLIIITELKELCIIKETPKVETYATVVAKRKPNNSQKEENAYYVEYKTDDGKSFECKVNEDVFNKLRAGDMGIISYQGMKYLGFRKAC